MAGWSGQRHPHWRYG
nr:hypothetical protein [Pseudomonas sp. Root71]